MTEPRKRIRYKRSEYLIGDYLVYMDPEHEKWCPRCLTAKPFREFGTNNSKRSKTKLNAYCKKCYSTYLHHRNLARSFGMTADQYEALFAHQEGRCAICLHQPRKMRLAVDHDHKTGEVRGLLCRMCNQSVLGKAHDDVEVLRRAVRYLEEPPSRVVFACPHLVEKAAA